MRTQEQINKFVDGTLETRLESLSDQARCLVDEIIYPSNTEFFQNPKTARLLEAFVKIKNLYPEYEDYLRKETKNEK